MAYDKTLKVTEIFPTASFDNSSAGAEFYKIPLTDLAGGGLELAEANADDGRKFSLAVLKAVSLKQTEILNDYSASQANSNYAEGASYEIGDKVIFNNIEFEAISAVTNAPAVLTPADWQENNVKQPVDNFTVSQGNPSIVSNTNGAELNQSFTTSIRYTNTFDIKNES
jgi:hypothetical protein